jgi:hypothetical protein
MQLSEVLHFCQFYVMQELQKMPQIVISIQFLILIYIACFLLARNVSLWLDNLDILTKVEPV